MLWVGLPQVVSPSSWTRCRGLMHKKVMIVDGETVVTGSFNYTWSAEHRNAENLLVIHDPTLAAEYTQTERPRGRFTASNRRGGKRAQGAECRAGSVWCSGRQSPQHDLRMARLPIL